jgi:uncharacterized membrane protein YhaH (DUF805 family)
MSTPDGQQGSYGPNPYPSGPQSSQAAGGPGTYSAEEDIPRQQASREDQFAGPGPGAGWAGAQQGTYNAYPPSSGYVPGGSPGPLSYLQGAPVGFAEAARGALGNIVTLQGRASRSAFWWFALLAAVVYLIVGGISDASRIAGIILDIVVGIPMLLASISVAVRRLHDSDRSGWWWWIGFVPFVGGIILLVFYVLRGTPGPNRYSVMR